MSENQRRSSPFYQFHPILTTGFRHNISPPSIEVIQPLQQTRCKSLVKSLGIAQIAIGITCVILTIMYFVKAKGGYWYTDNRRSSCGFWGGTIILVAGILQLLSEKRFLNKCLIVGTMVMCIIATCTSTIIFALGIVDTRFASINSDDEMKTDFTIMGCFMMLLGLGEIVISILSSALCCNALCCTTFDLISRPHGYIIVPAYQRRDEPNLNVPQMPCH